MTGQTHLSGVSSIPARLLRHGSQSVACHDATVDLLCTLYARFHAFCCVLSAFAVLGITASGKGVDDHPLVKAGAVTVIAAVGLQARVISKVQVKLSGQALPAGPPSVHFDRKPGTETLSITASALGAGTFRSLRQCSCNPCASCGLNDTSRFSP